VRFGNVLGSSGSVVPLFRRQIEKGGPVTVTDAAMTRYFMTIPEAVQLIIRAGNLGRGGDVFVLEMGEPVSIMELARNMIRLSGQEPDKDIRIEVVGPRAGEKLEEELFNVGERPVPTEAERIMKAERPPLDPDWVENVLEQVERIVAEGDEAFLTERIGELVKQSSPVLVKT
jgi:FlaA1/EpsC-like NDP-sugar epimerase